MNSFEEFDIRGQLDAYVDDDHIGEDEIIDFMESKAEEWGKMMWNAALEWAAENARANIKDYDVPYIEKDSILKGKL